MENVPARAERDLFENFIDRVGGREEVEEAEFIRADSSSGERWYVREMNKRWEKLYGSP